MDEFAMDVDIKYINDIVNERRHRSDLIRTYKHITHNVDIRTLKQNIS